MRLGLPPPRPDASRRQAEAALGRGGRRAGLRGVALCRRGHRAPLGRGGSRNFEPSSRAGDISYDSRHFVEKNVEALHKDLHDLLPLLAGYAKVVLATTMPTAPPPRWGKKKTAGKKVPSATAKIRGSFGISSTFTSQASAPRAAPEPAEPRVGRFRETSVGQRPPRDAPERHAALRALP